MQKEATAKAREQIIEEQKQEDEDERLFGSGAETHAPESVSFEWNSFVFVCVSTRHFFPALFPYFWSSKKSILYFLLSALSDVKIFVWLKFWNKRETAIWICFVKENKHSKMSAGVFVFDVIATLILSGALLFSYGNWLRQHLVTIQSNLYYTCKYFIQKEDSEDLNN